MTIRSDLLETTWHCYRFHNIRLQQGPSLFDLTGTYCLTFLDLPASVETLLKFQRSERGEQGSAPSRVIPNTLKNIAIVASFPKRCWWSITTDAHALLNKTRFFYDPVNSLATNNISAQRHACFAYSSKCILRSSQ